LFERTRFKEKFELVESNFELPLRGEIE